MPRTVHFASWSPEEQPKDEPENDHSPMERKNQPSGGKDDPFLLDHKDMERKRLPTNDDMLRIKPDEFITFSRKDNKESFVEILSNSKFPVTYKIQTTTPEKFRVRPRSGILEPGDMVTVSILLKPDQTLSESSKDKFLVMGLPVPQNFDLNQQMSEIWKHKSSNSPDVEQHRLCCVYKDSVMPENGISDSGQVFAIDRNASNTKHGPLGTTTNELSLQLCQLKRHLRVNLIVLYITLFLLMALSGYTIYLLRPQSNPLDSKQTTDTGAQVPDGICHNKSDI